MEIREYIDEIVKAQPKRIIFSNKKDSGYEFKKVRVNFIKTKNKEYYQVEKFTDKQVFHENIQIDILNEKFKEFMSCFKQCTALSEEFSFDIKISKKGKVFFNKSKQKQNINFETNHNKKKNYIIKESKDVKPLIDLGIFNENGKIINSKYDKYKQINRFIEIIDDEVKKIEKNYVGTDKKLHILDFGCGKSYLTFIVYYYFKEIKTINVKITGLDLKEDVIENCNKISEKYGYEDLKFEKGDINGFKYENNVDMVITLHACDTATDYALYNAINWNCGMIFSVPCCQHEINATMKPNSLDILSRYGIVKERLSALMTDAIRANILEAMGYKTQLLEFIDISHSPKNILIRAVKSNISNEKKKKSIEEIEALREEFGFEQTLYKLLKDRLC